MRKALLLSSLNLILIVSLASLAYADFFLQVGSFKNEENALQLSEKLKSQDHRAFVHMEEAGDPKSDWNFVRVGPFQTEAEALEKKAALREQGYTGEITVIRTGTDVPGEPAGQESAQKTEDQGKTASTPETPADTGTEKPIPDEAPGKRNITLRWDPSTDPELGGYKIYYDTDPGSTYDPKEGDYAVEGPPPITVGKDVREITLHGLTASKEYYFSITAFKENSSIESAYANEVSAPAVLPKPDFGETAEPVTPEKADSTILPADLSVTEEGPVRVFPGDIVLLDVPGQKDMSQAYDVDPNGYIYLTIAGRLKVWGLDVPALEERITQKLERYIGKGEKVTAKLVDQRRYIEIRGGLRYPGWYRVPHISEVRELTTLAGGLLTQADFSGIRIKRKTRDGFKEFRVRGRISLYPNDILEVPFPESYHVKVDPGDLLFVSVPQRQAPGQRPDTRDSADLRESFARNKITVDRNGYIYVPDHGHVLVKELTPEQIKIKITGLLPKYMATLGKVEVSIIEKAHFVDVGGHVRNPGRYNVPEEANLQAAIDKAGSALDGAIMSDVTIQRVIKGELKSLKVNLYQYNITGDPRLLPPLHENDIVFVPISSSFGNVKRTLMAWQPPTERLEKDTKKKVRIFGAVQNPGIYEPYEGMDLLDLMVLASGEREEADMSKILIIRNNQVEVEFNMDEFLKNKGEGPSLKMPKIYNGDTVYVNFVELKIQEPKEDKVWYITGEVKAPGQYKLWDNMTVLQAISRAGGLTEWADSDRITIVRTVAGKQENIPYHYGKGVAGKYPELNILILGDDVIVVP
ncbi:SLBB domain-containing protein [Thermodesulfobacteriota bacterium]